MALNSMESVAAYTLKKPGSDEEIKVGSFWENGPCIIYFMRRFGCQICRWQAKQINALVPEYKSKFNGQVIAIGPESLGAEEFADLKILDAEVFYDPEKKLYNTLQMKRQNTFSLIGSFFKKAAWETIGKSRNDAISGNFKGDIYQLGGLFAVEKGTAILKNYIPVPVLNLVLFGSGSKILFGGNILYQFRQNDFSEHANLPELASKLGISYVESKDKEPAPNMCASGSCAPVQPPPSEGAPKETTRG
uniref:Prostamide/prostaglandin F synthase n=1 Tax=Romanomermis culicivorax TaxID=13658 RepID=A0A915JYX3_ROMCU